MRELNTQELITVSGAGKTGAAHPDPLTLIKGLLASKGISVALDMTAHTVTITTPKGSKTIALPTPHGLPTMPAAPAPAADEPAA